PCYRFCLPLFRQDSMSHELPKTYDPNAIEPRWAEYWIRERLFEVETPSTGDSRPVFTILLPPPNVTGRLHMGHMLNQTEMDILTRWHRMRGDLSLWLPGTDHAGIATQMMVERQLATEGVKRQDLGREKFIERVWDWKRTYGGAIQAQMKLGDVAVAVNPNDDRYRALVGKKLRLPLMNREIPIIADELANPEFGTGAVKVTPAHDPKDFTMGKRHNLPMLKIMNESARIKANGRAYAGLDRYEARKRVLADL